MKDPTWSAGPHPSSFSGKGVAEAAGAYDAAGEDDDRSPSPSFDSEVEARLAREFAALRRQGRAAGWRLVREPAPLLAGGRVLIPDFALVRGELRVFVEVAGFWTPGYLARKRRALEQVSPDVPLVLAVAEESAAALTGLPFPLVPYRDAVPVHELLASVEARYGDFAARTSGAAERLAAACAAAAATGRLPEPRLARMLGCHSPGEILRALTAAPPPAGWEYLPGAGLCGPALRAAVSAALEGAWAAGGPAARLTPADLRALLPDAALPESDDALAALLERLPACTVVRGSLFEVEVRPPVPASRPTPPLPDPLSSPLGPEQQGAVATGPVITVSPEQSAPAPRTPSRRAPGRAAAAPRRARPAPGHAARLF